MTLNVEYIYNPNNIDLSKNVLVFVHGYRCSGKIWTTNNNIINKAVLSGYRTAIVELNPSDNIVSNGSMLTAQLREILIKYDVDKTVLICHCKGGIDVQSAIYHNNADTYIQSVITLSSPHWGTPIADIVFNNDVKQIKEETKEHHVKAMYDIQSSVMLSFRHVFDNDPRCASVPFFTVAATGKDKISNIFKVGSQKEFLNIFGPNDGFIPLYSTKKPGAIHIATIQASHSNITNHKKLWDIIEPYINGKYYKAERTSSLYKVNIPTKYDIKDAFIKSLSVIHKQKRTDFIITCVGLCFLIIGMYMLWHRHVSKTKVLLKNVSKR